jgi:hypothetical protein
MHGEKNKKKRGRLLHIMQNCIKWHKGGIWLRFCMKPVLIKFAVPSMRNPTAANAAM